MRSSGLQFLDLHLQVSIAIHKSTLGIIGHRNIMVIRKYQTMHWFYLFFIWGGYWIELNTKGGCGGQKLCDSSGPGVGNPICDNTYEGSSGDLKEHSHQCAASGLWDEDCIRSLCVSSLNCGGFVKKEFNNSANQGSAYWFYDLSIRNGSFSQLVYKCWKYKRVRNRNGNIFRIIGSKSLFTFTNSCGYTQM